MTSLPAKTMGIDRRGLLEVGNFADMIVFDPRNVKENATYLDPYQTATGFDEVMLNGIQVVVATAVVDERSGGRLLRQ
ncbi:MAG: N-acyl-D-amino acid deacylase, partial [Cyclobacteriaceae bacterium]